MHPSHTQSDGASIYSTSLSIIHSLTDSTAIGGNWFSVSCTRTRWCVCLDYVTRQLLILPHYWKILTTSSQKTPEWEFITHPTDTVKSSQDFSEGCLQWPFKAYYLIDGSKHTHTHTYLFVVLIFAPCVGKVINTPTHLWFTHTAHPQNVWKISVVQCMSDGSLGLSAYWCGLIEFKGTVELWPVRPETAQKFKSRKTRYVLCAGLCYSHSPSFGVKHSLFSSTTTLTKSPV